MTKMMRKRVLQNVRLIIAAGLAALTILGVAVTSDILAASDASAAYTDPICAQYPNEPGCAGTGTGQTQISTNARNILNVLLYFGGAVTIMFIIIGGLKLITSGGEPDKIKSGKQTLLFAIIGLVVVVLARVIIEIVLQQF
jgi:hypothetical protein